VSLFYDVFLQTIRIIRTIDFSLDPFVPKEHNRLLRVRWLAFAIRYVRNCVGNCQQVSFLNYSTTTFPDTHLCWLIRETRTRVSKKCARQVCKDELTILRTCYISSLHYQNHFSTCVILFFYSNSLTCTCIFLYQSLMRI